MCEKIIAYQFAIPDSFLTIIDPNQRSINIEGNYVDRISLTHGSTAWQHIWTFAAVIDDVGTCLDSNCPCTDTPEATFATQSPPFVDIEYFGM